MKKRRWLKVAGAVIVIAAIGAWGYYEALKRAWIRYNEYDIRSEGSLAVSPFYFEPEELREVLENMRQG